MIDTHTHLTDSKFDNDREDVILNAFNLGISLMINNTCSLQDADSSIDLSQKYKNIYSTFGIHPLDITDFNTFDFSVFDKYLPNTKVIAIGEIGLDYHYSTDNMNEQKRFFIKQLEIAQSNNFTVIIHARDSLNDVIEITKNYNLTGVFHCFSGDLTQLKTVLDMGYYIGFDCPITYNKNNDLIENLKYCPLDRILPETDCPYLPPNQKRGKRNEPAYVQYVYKKIEEVKNINSDILIDIIRKNTKTLFNKIKDI